MQKLHPKTKIVCTLGPATAHDETLRGLLSSGMNIARLNLSHGSLSQHANDIRRARDIADGLGVPIGMMVDIPGAKYRTGALGTDLVDLKQGDRITLTSRDVIGTKSLVSVNPPGIHRDTAVGKSVVLDDGLIELLVEGVHDDEVECEVIRGGPLTERRGVATPGKSPSQHFPDKQANQALEFAAEYGADFVALSTITGPGDVNRAREILNKLGHDPIMIAKIERAEAIDRFDEIMEVSDAIMVARGDMGVEVRLAQVPVIQKDLIARSNLAGKPVITATQMLESMIRSPVPTRAEVTDVANAIYDGTDAIMLSGETSVGKYPIEAVQVMFEVAVEAEASLPYDRMLVEKRGQLRPHTDDAIAYDACQTAHQLDAARIVAFTESGATAGIVSKYRPKTPIIALTPSDRVRRRLTLWWGVSPVTVPQIDTVEDFFNLGQEHAMCAPDVTPGSQIVLVAGLPIGVPGSTNLLRVLTIAKGNTSRRDAAH